MNGWTTGRGVGQFRRVVPNTRSPCSANSPAVACQMPDDSPVASTTRCVGGSITTCTSASTSDARR